MYIVNVKKKIIFVYLIRSSMSCMYKCIYVQNTVHMLDYKLACMSLQTYVCDWRKKGWG